MAEGDTSSREPEQLGVRHAAKYLVNNLEATFQWVSRMATMIFTFLYIFPVFGGSSHSYYAKALLASGTTNVIRLSQRLPRFEFSKAYLGHLLVEDSCHYILFVLIYYANPVTLVLLPGFLFAFLHSASFTVNVMKMCGWEQNRLVRLLSQIMERHSTTIFRLIAYTEIFLMPLNVLMIFIGRGSFLTPLVYYRFLSLRYQSRRNPYTRSVFYELRLVIEVLASQPSIPMFLRQLCHKVVALVSRLAPAVNTT